MRTLSTPAIAALASGTAAIVQLIHIAFPSGTVALNTSNWHLPWYHNFSRASTATYFDSTGTLQTAAINEPRVAYDPATLRCLGFLAEAAATNFLTYASTPNVWMVYATGTATGTISVVSDPQFGNVVRITKTGGAAGDRYGLTRSFSGLSGSSYALSVLGKMNVAGSDGFFLYVDAARLPSGLVVTHKTVTGSALNVWQKLSGVGSGSLAGSGQCYSWVQGAVGSSIDIAFPQIELGTTPTSYIPTTTTAVTRAADVGALTYQGAYGLGSVSPITDKPGELQGITLELAGGDTARIALALDDADEVQGTPLTIRTAIIDTTSYAIVDALVDWVGTLDTMSIAEDGLQCTIRVTAETKAIDLLRGNPAYYSSSDQRALAPLDGSFDYVVDQDGKADVWPARSFFYR